MKRLLSASIFLGLALMVTGSLAMAQVNGKPTGGTQCYINGKFVFVPSGGCPSGGGNSQRKVNQPSQPSYDPAAAEAAAAAAEAERQRQLEIERQRQREIEAQIEREREEAKRRQEEFERKKQEALSSMKGITESELGLKDDGAGAGLKDLGDTSGGLRDAPRDVPPGPTEARKPECQWGDQGSSVVDLRCLGLDPDKPIVLDPHVVRGQERAFPAQIDPAVFQNANYNKGFEALMRLTFSVKDAMDAVAYFKAAQLQRPNDPLVRNGLLLAQDILKARQQKEKDDKAKAAELTCQAYTALISGETASARAFITRARELDPDNNNLRFLDSLTAIVGPESATAATPERRAAYKIVANGLVSISNENYAAAASMLEAARRLQPDDKFIGTLLVTMRNYEAGRVAANKPAPK